MEEDHEKKIYEENDEGSSRVRKTLKPYWLW